MFGLLSMVALFFCIGCGENFYYQKKYTLDEQQWTYADSLQFEMTIPDTSITYNLYLEIEHGTDYSKQNLYTKIHTTFPDGKRLSEQISIELADKTGKWNGNCSRDVCTARIFLQEGAVFNQIGDYTFTLEQFMRINPLPSIKSISFMLEKTKPDQ